MTCKEERLRLLFNVIAAIVAIPVPRAVFKEKHHDQQEDDPQRIDPKRGVWEEGDGTIGIDDGGCVLKDDGANGWAYDARDEDLSNDACSLELAGAAFRDEVSDLCAKDGHSHEVAAHHAQRTQEDGKDGGGDIEDSISNAKERQGYANADEEPLFIV